ncbi:glycosyltransferase [Homoserinimonas aerilata]|uniref:glycosyltransferase n=1 Tax=Homoserinimonas aerilata TaxID=1162970 RepID=UPI00163A7F7D|nr:glycosyltransferase [Homoserinimonas aerilata]
MTASDQAAGSGPLDVAAVVVTYNSSRHVTGLLDSLPDAFGDLSYSVVVVDNGSSDDTVELLARRTDCTVVPSTNDGYAAGINRAVRESPDASAILILNPDATLDPDSVPRMLETLRRPGTGIVAPRVREEDGRLSPTIRRGPNARPRRRAQLHGPARLQRNATTGIRI